MCFVNSIRIPTDYCILLAVLLLPYAAGAIVFTSKYQGQTMTGLVGSSVSFTWSFSGDVRTVIWGLKEDGINSIAANGKLVSLRKIGSISLSVPQAYIGRVSGRRSGDASSGQAIFTLSSITKDDAIYFGCKIEPADTLNDSPVFDPVQLVVNEPLLPQISLSSVPASYNEGSPVNISCTAAGKPDPDVKWMKNTIMKSSGKKTAFLTFNSIKRADNGQYTCKANNSVGNDVSYITLVVHYIPEGTTLNTCAAENTVTQGNSVKLTCHVTAAYPQVSQYRFYLNGSLVKAARDSQYTINNVQRSQHYGKYKCIPHNDVGDGAEATTTLQVNVPVQFIEIPQNVTVHETNAIAVSCDASGFPAPSITWTKHGQGNPVMKEPNTQRSDRNDAGIYVCTANNGVGQAKTATTYVTVQYPPTIQEAITLAVESWIGQTVTLKCVSDGVPTPTLTWYKPDGSQITSSTATENTVNVKMNVDQDFGDYKCNANNGLTPADDKIVNIKQIRVPTTAEIYGLPSEETNDTITLKWREPNNNGKAITQYTVYQRIVTDGKPGEWDELKTITDVPVRELKVKLEKGNVYEFVVTATNELGESLKENGKIKRILASGIPSAVEIGDIPSEVTDSTITLKWSEPQNNGKEITQYTVYQIMLTFGKLGEWNRLKTITDISVRELKIDLEKGKVYEFVVTATNELGESLREDGKIKRVLASGIPAAVEMNDIPSEVTDKTIALKWSKPQNYGREITQYTVYQRIVTDGKPGEWAELKKITDVSVRELKVKLEKGKEYEFVVTATNVHGESLIQEGKIKRVKAIRGSSCDEEKIILHVVYVNVIIFLLMINLIQGVFIWITRRRSVISKTNRRNKRTRCDKELIVLNPMPKETENQPPSMVPLGAAATNAAPSTGDYMPLHPSTRSLEINREQVEIIKVIGKGAFSQVAKATAWNISGNEEHITVAVKMLKANAPDSDRKDLLAEVELMMKMKPHPHVIKLIGCVTKTDPLLVLIEYVPFGDLLGYLRKSRGLNDTYFKDPDVKPQTNLTAEQLMRFAWQVADGMFYLSSKKIIHRDLAARNILVGEGEKCKVTDFGMARNVHQDDIYTRQSRGRLPVKWTAYEALLYATYTTQSDVWSYGVLLYEILTVGGSPYPGIHARQIARKLQEGFRMPKPKHVDNKLYQIMLNCWEENPSDRPTFAKLKNTMKEMERNHKTCVNLKQYDNSLYANVEDLTAE